MLSRWLSSLLLGVLSLTLAGCWDRKEINDLAIVMASGLDATPEGTIRSSIQIALPSRIGQAQTGGGGDGGGSGETGGQPFLLETAVGVDIKDNIANLQQKLSRKLFVAQRRVFVIGEELARRGLRPILDYFGREPNSRMRTYILLARGEAANILRTPYPLEKEPAEAMRELVKSGVTLKIDLKTVFQALATEQSVVLPVVENVKKNEDQKQTLRVSGAGIFRQDKLIGWMDSAQARGLIWLRGEANEANITVRVPGGQGHLSAQVIRSKTKIEAKKESRQIVIVVTAHSEDDLLENSSALDLSKIENISAAERLLSDDLRKRIETTLHLLQNRYHADVIGFGKVIDRTYPSDWNSMKNNWEKQGFPELKVVLKCEVKVRRIGISGRSLTSPGEAPIVAE